MSTALSVILAKVAGLNLAAKTAVGVAVAAGTVGAAAGVPVVLDEIAADQQMVVVSEVVEEPTVDPTTDSTADPTTDPTEEPVDEATDDSEDAVDESGAQDAENFGQWVRTQAREGGVNGQDVAEAAHERNRVRAEERTGEESPDDADQSRTRDRDRDEDQDGDEDCDQDQDQSQAKDQDQSRDRDQGDDD